MKTTPLMLMTFVAFVTTAHAICWPGVCIFAKCYPITSSNCKYKIERNSGYCGCCDVCTFTVAPGHSCRPHEVVSIITFPGKFVCGEEYFCSPKTRKCEKLEIMY